MSERHHQVTAVMLAVNDALTGGLALNDGKALTLERLALHYGRGQGVTMDEIKALLDTPLRQWMASEHVILTCAVCLDKVNYAFTSFQERDRFLNSHKAPVSVHCTSLGQIGVGRMVRYDGDVFTVLCVTKIAPHRYECELDTGRVVDVTDCVGYT